MAPPPIDRLTRVMNAKRAVRFDCTNDNCRRVIHFGPGDLYGWFRRDRMLEQLKVRCDRCGRMIEGATHDEIPGKIPPPPRPAPINLETRPSRPPREPDPPRRLFTLAEWERDVKWVWWFCERYLNGKPCGFSGVLVLKTYVERFGPEASETVLCENLQCPRCLGIGGVFRPPSPNGSHGLQAFPTQCVIEPLIVSQSGERMR